MDDHLTPIKSDRGFTRLPAIPSDHPGGEVRVYESSAAEQPCIWLNATAGYAFNRPDGSSVVAPIHLTVDNARKLAEQLLYLAEHHYQEA